MENQIKANAVTHAFLVIVCYQCEFYEIQIGWTAFFAKGFEMLGVMLNFFNNFYGAVLVLRYFAYREFDTHPKCYDYGHMEAWLGGTIPWICVELLIYFGYITTMMLLMVKQRFGLRTTADNSKMFDK